MYKVLNGDKFSKLWMDIIEFRGAFGLPCNQPNNDNTELHIELLREELIEGFSSTERALQIDGIIDSAYVVMGYFVENSLTYETLKMQHPYLLGLLDTFLCAAENLKFNFFDAWGIVHRSNLSKICTLANVGLTLDFYRELGISAAADPVHSEHTVGEALFIVKVKETTVLGDKTFPSGKVLKCIEYMEADLSRL